MFTFTGAGLRVILVSHFYTCLHLFVMSLFLLKGGDHLKVNLWAVQCSPGNTYRVSCCYTCNVIVAFFFGNQLSASGDFCSTWQSVTGFTKPVESVKL